MPAKRIDNREFVITYLRSDTIEDVAKNLNMPLATAKNKVYTLRQKGVKLPKKTRKAIGELEVAQLNSIINKWKKETKQS